MPNNLLLPGNTTSMTLSSTNNPTTTKKRYSWAIVAVVLFVGRAVRVLASWDTYSFLQSSSVPISIFAFYCYFWASILLCLLQRPWKGKRISKRRFTRVCLLSCMTTVALVCWLQGLHMCGLFRTLFFDGVELPLVFVYSLIGSGESLRRQKLRGLVIIGLAYLLLFTSSSFSSLFSVQPRLVATFNHVDAPQQDSPTDEKSTSAAMLSKLRSFATEPSSSEASQHDQQSLSSDPDASQIRGNVHVLFDEGGVDTQRDHERNMSPVGILFVSISSVLLVLYRLFSLKISSSLDGPKRVFAISNSLAVMILLPICVLQFWFATPSDASSTWTSLTIHSVTFALGWIVIPFYTQSFVSSKLGHLGSTELNFGSTLATLFILNLWTELSWRLIPEIISGLLQLGGIHSLLSGRAAKSYGKDITFLIGAFVLSLAIEMNAALGGEL